MFALKSFKAFVPNRFQHLVFGLIMSFLMSFFMSGVITLINLGWVEGLFGFWMQAWLLAFLFAFPTIVLLGPWVRKLVSSIVIAK